jgi:hypothetical protein
VRLGALKVVQTSKKPPHQAVFGGTAPEPNAGQDFQWGGFHLFFPSNRVSSIKKVMGNVFGLVVTESSFPVLILMGPEVVTVTLLGRALGSVCVSVEGLWGGECEESINGLGWLVGLIMVAVGNNNRCLRFALKLRWLFENFAQVVISSQDFCFK